MIPFAAFRLFQVLKQFKERKKKYDTYALLLLKASLKV